MCLYDLGKDAKLPEGAPDRELTIMVVGETARADHFSLNGYERITNPLLEQEKIINFPNFSSCGTSTAVSVPCMFSIKTRSEFDTKNKARSMSNALDILSQAGVSVLCRDNNSSSKGAADRVPYQNYRLPA